MRHRVRDMNLRPSCDCFELYVSAVPAVCLLRVAGTTISSAVSEAKLLSDQTIIVTLSHLRMLTRKCPATGASRCRTPLQTAVMLHILTLLARCVYDLNLPSSFLHPEL